MILDFFPLKSLQFVGLIPVHPGNIRDPKNIRTAHKEAVDINPVALLGVDCPKVK
jgi:hypothetical protein